MLHLNNSEESVQDFISKLSKKENLFSRRRKSGRLSVGHSKNLAPGEGNKTRYESIIETEEGQPLVDVSNQQSRDNDFSLYEEDSRNETSKVVPKSALLREFHERRRSKLSTMGVSNLRRTLATPSQNKPHLLLSEKKKTPSHSLSGTAYRNSPIGAFERIKDPSVRLMFEQMKINHKKESGSKSKAKVNPSPRRRVQFGASSRKGSSYKKYSENGLQNKPQTLLLQNQEMRTFSLDVPKNNDQDCCRALMFTDLDEGHEEDETKPLPEVQLSSVKTCGSMLTRRSTITINKSAASNQRRISSSMLTTEANSKVKLESSSNCEIRNDLTLKLDGTFQRRHSGIPKPNISKGPDFNQRRRSAMLSSNRLTINIKESLLPITKRNKLNASINESRLTSHVSKRNSRIPLYSESPESEGREPVPVVIVNPESCENSEKNSTSFSITVGSLENDIGDINHNKTDTTNNKADTTICASSSGVPCPMKDAATNTCSSEEFVPQNWEEVGSKIEKILQNQKEIEDTFELMTLEYFQKGKNLLLEYKKNACEGIKEIKKHFDAELSSMKNILAEENRCKLCKSQELKSTKKDYKFLGTPMPKKNRKNLLRSFSDPPSPFNRSPSVREASFHSVDSVISPFTNIVGDCDRPSLMPMTPRMRHNISDLKTCLNDQLEILFR